MGDPDCLAQLAWNLVRCVSLRRDGLFTREIVLPAFVCLRVLTLASRSREP